MPSFIKTEKDEKMWKKAKDKVLEQKGKKKLSEDDWALVTHIYKNIKKSEATLIKALKNCLGEAKGKSDVDKLVSLIEKEYGRQSYYMGTETDDLWEEAEKEDPSISRSSWARQKDWESRERGNPAHYIHNLKNADNNWLIHFTSIKNRV